MRAIMFDGPGLPLRELRCPIPKPREGQLLLRVRACGVCRTDLHLLDGDVTVSSTPRILGHQVVGTLEDAGPARARAGEDTAAPVREAGAGALLGVPWLGYSCGECRWCLSGRENLCPHARFTGRDIDGGMAEYVVADERFCFAIPDGYPESQAAPLLCAGLIGFRSLAMCGEAQRIGLYGFGAAAHIIAQVAAWQGRSVHAFTRPGDEVAQAFALELGAAWAGGSDEQPPAALDAAIIFAPDGSLVPLALRAVAPGGTVVCGGIHMSDIPSFPYSDLWGERVLRSVANLTRADSRAFLALAPRVPVRTRVTLYPLEAAGDALEDLRAGRFTGAAVLVP